MDLINATGTVEVIVGGATGYLAQFLPIFAMIIGLALALSIISALIEMFTPPHLRQNETDIQ